MTCIAALVQKGVIWMGSDHAATDSKGRELEILENRKVFAKKDSRGNVWMFGFCGAIRNGQLIEHAMDLPAHSGTKDNILGFLVVEFVPRLQSLLRQHGAIMESKGKPSESGTAFIIGLAEKLFYVDEEFQIQEPSNAYAAIGDGRGPSIGALGATEGLLEPLERITKALEMAQEFTPSVRDPFRILNSAEPDVTPHYVKARRRPMRRR